MKKKTDLRFTSSRFNVLKKTGQKFKYSFILLLLIDFDQIKSYIKINFCFLKRLDFL